ncbi:CDP-glycerol glycerophosphotransferase [Terrisporobacter glycolicus]|nr:CDP-glycerol glycerophosphotransferase [Terrisporobacter glycolicus]
MIKGLKKKYKKIRKCFKKLSFNKMKYRKYIKDLPINEKSILLESQHGRTYNGNMYYLLKELLTNSSYKDYDIYFTVKESNKNNIFKALEKYNLDNFKTVSIYSKEYYKVVATSKYLFNDTTFLPFFIKRKGQIYTNTWHGTPLKTLGKNSNADAHLLGNVQRNFILSDYLLYPNKFTMDHMLNDYMLENICNSRPILGGYPRNSVFFDDDIRSQVRKYYEINDDIQVIAYMPTYRNHSIPQGKTIENTYILYHLLELDKRLIDKQIMYVNIHPLANSRIDYRMFKHIKPMPKYFETYEFLAATDCLITDYSSVMFDYALTKNKIILFTYDKEEYLNNRGTYLDINKLPFPLVENVDELFNEIITAKNYNDDEFINIYCSYDSKYSCKNLCDTVILNKNNIMPTFEIPTNNKENVLIYVGNMAKNGITTSVKNLLLNLDLDKKNYYINYIPRKIKHNLTQFQELKSIVNYIPIQGKMILTLKEEIIYHLYNKKFISASTMAKHLDTAYSLEIKRSFGDINFSHAIQFCGYENSPILKYSKFKCNNIIYVHSNMVEEIKTRNNQRKDVLSYAYNAYDKVAMVTVDMSKSINCFCKTSNKLVANNLIDYNRVIKMSMDELLIDNNTIINTDLERMKTILNSNSKKFVTIGRFSQEKGHLRLIDAFEKVWSENNDTYLFIIGGHGKLYNPTLKYAQSKVCSENIIIIKSMSNPYTVLKKCDYFVLSSYYEGFGLVIAEADMLGLPVISTDIDGPKQFMLKNKGTLVENSTNGIYNGMIDLLNNKVKCMNVDYKEYNKEAVKQFENLLA